MRMQHFMLTSMQRRNPTTMEVVRMTLCESASFRGLDGTGGGEEGMGGGDTGGDGGGGCGGEIR